MNGASVTIYPVILSGGVGSRLWPLSRRLFPKQLLDLVTEKSMLQETALRVAGGQGIDFAPPLVICNAEHRFIIAEQLRQIGIVPSAIVLEPEGRNTAPAAAVAATMVQRMDSRALVLLLPADAVVNDRPAFLAAVNQAAAAARHGFLATFGIVPSRPETGYGYIERGAPLAQAPGAFAVERFVEKPDAAVAAAYLAGGRHVWNSGMFLFGAAAFLAELDAHAPAIRIQAQAAIEAARTDLDFLRLDANAFGKCPSISIDYAVMEKTNRAAVVPAAIGWSDVGAWDALWELGEKDANGNVAKGDVLAHETKNSYLRSETKLLSTVGVENLVVVVTEDAVLVADKAKAQGIKAIVDRLGQAGRSEADAHARVLRPWGSYQTVDHGRRYQVKRITVEPGGRLSLQKHAKRAEHWVVVNGTARVTRNDEVMTLRENESVYIPLGAVHRLENPGTEPLNLIEVQSGGYLGEDDIVRLEDTYGRTET
jgi:mannose-1-phosphate guanylyltransferase/mannose-1-phosphate guanylyltransferase/mannose-6-phosphate isomerase